MYEELAQRAEDFARNLRAIGSRPLSELDVDIVNANADALLTSLFAHAPEALKPGTGLDVTPRALHRERAVISTLPDVYDALESAGYFAQFNQPARQRVQAAIEALDRVPFDVVRTSGRGGDLTPVHLVDIIAWAIQVAVTGQVDASTWATEADSPWLRPVD